MIAHKLVPAMGELFTHHTTALVESTEQYVPFMKKPSFTMLRENVTAHFLFQGVEYSLIYRIHS